MNKRIALLVAAATVALACAGRAEAYDETHHGHNARYRASLRPWHGRWYNVQYGQPVAIVIPPTAEMSTDYAWGSVSSRMTRIISAYPLAMRARVSNGVVPVSSS